MRQLRGHPARALGLVAALVALGCPRVVLSDEPPPTAVLRLTEAGGGGACTTREALAAAANGLLGRQAIVDTPDPEVVIDVRFERAATNWSAHASMTDRAGTALGTRDISASSSDCHRLDDSLALVVALAVDSLRTVKPALVATHVSLPPQLIDVQKAPTATWGTETTATFYGSWGLLPGAAFGFGFGAAITPPKAWPIAVDASFWLPRRAVDTQKESGSTTGADFSAWEVGASVCAPLVHRVVEPRICLGAELGQLHAEAVGLASGSATTGWLADATLRAVPMIHLGDRVALDPGIGFAVPFVRDKFTYTHLPDRDLRLLHQVTPVVFRFDLGASVTIP